MQEKYSKYTAIIPGLGSRLAKCAPGFHLWNINELIDITNPENDPDDNE